MLVILAALMLFLVGAMHSILGGKHLIDPLLKRDDFPILLGSVKNAKLTLWVGWHTLTLFWWCQAGVLIAIALDPAIATTAVLVSLSFASGLTGILALALSRGKHRSWVFFLPLSALTGFAAFL